MPRNRAFDEAEVVRAARDQFWFHGYEATSIADLERVTGLNRSSLYQAFGTKRGLFDLALRCYLDEVAWPRLAVLEAPGAGPAAAARYFERLAAALPAQGPAGCLGVNTMVELGPHDDAARFAGNAYRARVADAFRAALTPEFPAGIAARRADMLTGALIGVLVTARLSPETAAATARVTAAEISGWPT